MSYDVIIAGGGPTGLTAALYAATEGLSVLLAETKEHITRQTRPCCSMWLLEPCFHNEGWTFTDDKIYFHRNDFFVPYAGGTVDLYRSVKMSAGGNALTVGKKLMPVAKVINKTQLLEALLDRAVQAGVEIRPRTTCLGLEESSSGIKARLRHKGAEEWVSAKYLIAADGVDSRIVQSMGLNAGRKIVIRSPIVHYYFADVQTPYADSWMMLIGDGFNGVSGSMLPKPDTDGYTNVYEIGAVPPPGSGMSGTEAMRRLLAHDMMKGFLSGGRLFKKMGCSWTVWTPIEQPARGRVIIAGDAASFQEVENQGALMCGYRAAGAIAARERGEDGFADYNRFWQTSFEFNDPETLKETWKGFIFQYMGNENIDYLLSLAGDRILDGFLNHFTCAGVIFDFFKTQLPRMQKERPELAEKIRQFEQFRLEDNLVG